MNVLLVTFGSVLKPRGGLPVRSRTTTEILDGLGVTPIVLSSKEPAHNGPLPWRGELHTARRKPWHGFSAEFARLIGSLSVECSAIIISNAMFMPALALSRSSLPVVWDTNECQSLHYSRLPRTPSNRLASATWHGLEAWAARRSQLAVAIGSVERDWWTSLYPGLDSQMVVVDHMAIARRTDPINGRAALVAGWGRPVPGKILVFVGTTLAKHNRWAAEWLLRVLAPGLPSDSLLVIAGAGTESLEVPARAEGKAVCLGNVEDIDAVIAAADYCLAPLASGAGIKTKVLHYLAHGKPVIGTPVAFEGLAGAPGLLSTSLAGFPAAIAGALSGEMPPPDLTGQAAWLELHHGRARIEDQWKSALKITGLL